MAVYSSVLCIFSIFSRLRNSRADDIVPVTKMYTKLPFHSNGMGVFVFFIIPDGTKMPNTQHCRTWTEVSRNASDTVSMSDDLLITSVKRLHVFDESVYQLL